MVRVLPLCLWYGVRADGWQNARSRSSPLMLSGLKRHGPMMELRPSPCCNAVMARNAEILFCAPCRFRKNVSARVNVECRHFLKKTFLCQDPPGISEKIRHAPSHDTSRMEASADGKIFADAPESDLSDVAGLGDPSSRRTLSPPGFFNMKGGHPAMTAFSET